MPSSPILSALLQQMADAFGVENLPPMHWTGQGGLRSPFYVTELAAASMGFAAGLLTLYRQGKPTPVTTDCRLASFWFGMSLRPQGWQLPGLWDALAGDYAGRDGWIRLHTNAAPHRKAALAVLGAVSDRSALAERVRHRDCDELEAAVVAAGGCAATMRSPADWRVHPQGRAVAAKPLVRWHSRAATGAGPALPVPDPARPLRGVRILDLTRVLAGPVAGRFLAGFGAEVLRIDPPDWDEPGVIPEVTLGKRCARLDLRSTQGRETLLQLLSQADVLLHGYRPGALDALGLGETERHACNPDLIDVALDAYGWSGPWAGRRGFDSLVQMSSGLAALGMTHAGAERPVPLPVQALDHACGYLLAAAVLQGLRQCEQQGQVVQARLSLARTAQLLLAAGHDNRPEPLAPETAADRAPRIEQTDWGAAQRVRFPLTLAGCEVHWDYPACRLGSAAAQWSAQSPASRV